MDIRNLAKSIVIKYDSRNPFDIAKSSGALLVFAPLKEIRGFYQYIQRNSIIYVDSGLSEHEQKFVCAHELGHMLLHKKSNTMYMDTKTFLNSNKYENEANLFAIELLVPDETIMENWNLTIEQLTILLGYEKKLIELKLESYQKI